MRKCDLINCEEVTSSLEDTLTKRCCVPWLKSKVLGDMGCNNEFVQSCWNGDTRWQITQSLCSHKTHNCSPPKLLLKLLEGYCLVRRILLMDFILSPLLRSISNITMWKGRLNIVNLYRPTMKVIQGWFILGDYIIGETIKA